MTYLLVRAFAPFINLFTLIVNLFIWRNKKVILFGSWMGDKFTDNPRFMFQYLHAHRDEYDIKKLVWVTRNEKVYEMLKTEGYEVYMMHNWRSFYYHFKAGVHIICNISFPVKGYNGDIMGHLSGHAVKINMYHGVGIKAGKSTGENTKSRGTLGRLRYNLRNSRLFCAIFTPGHWDKCYLLSTSVECSRRDAIFSGVDQNWFIESGYPRDCKPVKLMPEEQKVVNFIRRHKTTILYVPTFRDHGEIPHLLSDERLRQWLVENGYLWVEKPHPAAKNNVKIDGLERDVLYLESSFDINVVLPEITILISDYSSVTYDALAFGKSVLYYAPDYQHYLTKERGFLCDYKELTAGFEAETVEELIQKLDRAFNDEVYQQELQDKIKKEQKFVLCDNKEDCGQIADAIYRRLGVLKKL